MPHASLAMSSESEVSTNGYWHQFNANRIYRKKSLSPVSDWPVLMQMRTAHPHSMMGTALLVGAAQLQLDGESVK